MWLSIKGFENEMNPMTSDEILSKLYEYERIAYKFKNSVPQWMMDKLKNEHGKDWNVLLDDFNRVLKVVGSDKARLDRDASLRWAVSEHIQRGKWLFDYLEMMTGRIN